jgi:hypothetical protein
MLVNTNPFLAFIPKLFTAVIREHWGKLSTVDLLVLTSFYQLLFVLKLYFLFYQTSCRNEEGNCTVPFPYVRFPCCN